MRYLSTLFITIIYSAIAFGQQKKMQVVILDNQAIEATFSAEIRKILGINVPILSVYKYKDKSGQYYCILAESNNKIPGSVETPNKKIKALGVKLNHGSFIKLWEINDNVINKDEIEIWFWPDYIDFKDYDGDGLIDPMITYRTYSGNENDGRVKFIIIFKGKKIAIRHKNGSLDFQRETQVDKSFYALPKTLKVAVMEKMELMTARNEAIFPAGWQEAMNNKKTNFDERH